MIVPESAVAREFVEHATFHWHQRFHLAPDVLAPGVNNIDSLLQVTPLPASLEGKSVLDVGTTNGAVAFECERRGASRVVAVDILDDRRFGFAAIAELLQSNVQFVQASVYELADTLREEFDLVIFWGVLYHLRHPLLGLDSLRRLSRGRVMLESAVCDHAFPDAGPLAQFHRLDDLGGDGSNWWSPSIRCLQDWVISAGFTVQRTVGLPIGQPATRAMMELDATPGPAEYRRVSYERPLLLQRIELSD